MMSKSMKSICFVHPLPFFLYIFSKFSLWYLYFLYTESEGGTLYPPPKFLLILLFCVLFGFFSIHSSFFNLTRLLFSPIISVLSIFLCHISQILTFFINILLNYGDSLYIISFLLQGYYNLCRHIVTCPPLIADRVNTTIIRNKKRTVTDLL